MAGPPYTAGQKLRASDLNNGQPIIARRTTDSAATVSNTTLANDTQLFVPVAANLVYRMEMRLRYTSGTVPDFKFGHTFPAGLTMFWVMRGNITLNELDRIETSGGIVDGNGATVMNVTGTGLVIVGSTSGTLQIQWAQNTSDPSNTIMKAGSYLMLTQIA